MIYAKHKEDRSFGAMDIKSGNVGVGLVFATLIPDIDRAKDYADKLTEHCPDFRFQVREAGKTKVVYDPANQKSDVKASQVTPHKKNSAPAHGAR